MNMKYNIKAFLLTEIKQTEGILVWCKGPICYRASSRKLKFLFPWNVKKIVFKNIESFPVSFWGIRGSQKLNVEDISNKVFRWNSGEQWSDIANHSALDDFDDNDIKSHLNELVSSEIIPLRNVINETGISYNVPAIINLKKEVIPNSILTQKK
jgi:hypothetical protein